MKQIKYPWVVYDTTKVPNEFRCLICGETLVVYSAPRFSTYLVMGRQFADDHCHKKETKNVWEER